MKLAIKSLADVPCMGWDHMAVPAVVPFSVVFGAEEFIEPDAPMLAAVIDASAELSAKRKFKLVPFPAIEEKEAVVPPNFKNGFEAPTMNVALVELLPP